MRDKKEFYKFTGYGGIGFSPDGKYLIFSSSEHFTPIGFLLHNMITGFLGNVYILDLESGKSSRFVHAYKIPWLMD